MDTISPALPKPRAYATQISHGTGWSAFAAGRREISFFRKVFSMKLDQREVRHVADLARLSVTDDEAAALTDQLNRILGYMDRLAELDTRDIQPMAHALTLDTPFREDRAQASLDPEDALANAPDRDANFFRVPRVI